MARAAVESRCVVVDLAQESKRRFIPGNLPSRDPESSDYYTVIREFSAAEVNQYKFHKRCGYGVNLLEMNRRKLNYFLSVTRTQGTGRFP